MKIIRWLLSHSFLILLIVVVIYGYMFWGNLFGKETPAGKAIAYLSSEFVEVEEFVNAVKAKQAQLSGEKISPQAPAKTVETTKAVAVVNNASHKIAQNDPVKQPVEQTNIEYQPAPASDNSTQKRTQHVPVVADVEKLTDSQGRQALNKTQSAVPAVAAINSDAKENFVSPEIERQLENVDDQGKVVDRSQGRDAVTASWILARKSFYQRNYQLSEQNYRNVIDSTEDNFDAYGELGNVYFNQGKKQQAATAYFEAATILVRKGQLNRARSMVGLLNHLDKTKASELQQLIDAALS